MDACEGEQGGFEQALAALACELRCPRCSHLFTAPVSLPCAHVLCSDCAHNALAGAGVYRNECPVCHKPTYARDLRSNTKVAAVIELFRKLRDASGGVDTPRAQSEEEEEEERGSPCDAQALLRWAAEQQALGTPCCEDVPRLEADARALQAALAVVHARLRHLGVPQHRWHFRVDAPDSAPPSAASGEAAANLIRGCTVPQLRILCRQFFHRSNVAAWNAAKMRTRLAGVDLDSLQAALVQES